MRTFCAILLLVTAVAAAPLTGMFCCNFLEVLRYIYQSFNPEYCGTSVLAIDKTISIRVT